MLQHYNVSLCYNKQCYDIISKRRNKESLNGDNEIIKHLSKQKLYIL